MELLIVIGWIAAALIGWSLDRWGLFSRLAVTVRRHLPALGSTACEDDNVFTDQINHRRSGGQTLSEHGLLDRLDHLLPIGEATTRILSWKGLVPVPLCVQKTRRGTS
jgi:hypothetical protein